MAVGLVGEPPRYTLRSGGSKDFRGKVCCRAGTIIAAARTCQQHGGHESVGHRGHTEATCLFTPATLANTVGQKEKFSRP